MTATDEALLSLIVDDATALRVLAAWGALGLPLTALTESMPQLAALSGATMAGVEAVLPRLRAARVLVDGGTTELGDRLLQQRVRTALDAGSATGRRRRR